MPFVLEEIFQISPQFECLSCYLSQRYSLLDGREPPLVENQNVSYAFYAFLGLFLGCLKVEEKVRPH